MYVTRPSSALVETKLDHRKIVSVQLADYNYMTHSVLKGILEHKLLVTTQSTNDN